MAKKDPDKKLTKRELPKRGASGKQSESALKRRKTKAEAIEFKERELVIRFEKRSEILPKLLEAVGYLSNAHFEILGLPLDADAVLGTDRAEAIVSGCAHSTSWLSTLGELGLNPLIFRDCVSEGVDEAGFVPPPLSPSPSTRLIDVIAAIQGAPQKP
jgi:hypothetical protein